MCGRFTLTTPARDLVEVFELIRERELSPRYNIAPTQKVAVMRQDGKTRLSLMRWGGRLLSVASCTSMLPGRRRVFGS